MNKKITGILILLCLAACGAAAYFRSETAALRAQNEQLTRRAADLEQTLETERTGLEELKRATQTGSDSEKRELLKLRNDVTQLRANEQKTVKVETENKRLQSENQQLREQVRIGQAQVQRMQVLQNPAVNPPNPEQPPATDPLAFYRRNPELMRRYFPHLVPQTNGTEQAAPQ